MYVYIYIYTHIQYTIIYISIVSCMYIYIYICVYVYVSIFVCSYSCSYFPAKTSPIPIPRDTMRLVHQVRHRLAGARARRPQEHRAPRLVADVDPGADLQLVVDLMPATRLGTSGHQEFTTIHSINGIFSRDIPLHRPYIGLIYARYLHFRILKFPLTVYWIIYQ